MFKAIFAHWQSSLFGLVSAVGVALVTATQAGNLSDKQIGAAALAAAGLFLKGLVSADASAIK